MEGTSVISRPQLEHAAVLISWSDLSESRRRFLPGLRSPQTGPCAVVDRALMLMEMCSQSDLNH
ncbi:unnamed protein product [Prunus armeniaca]|uniref:Uncharacterized protein n=1 Tax=Prunus armeniaca TaxID=36596 RepID=A0A6J5XNW5_PRUAR|nr:unnamed protein product [Prunus armeniaca]CAB4314093.1 unnamed protein product [Prunus armeniaca]